MSIIGIRVLKCQHCGTLALSVEDENGGGTRVTSHKCAGMWSDKHLFRDVYWSDLLKACGCLCEAKDAQGKALEKRINALLRGLRYLLDDSALPRREVENHIRAVLRADRNARTKSANSLMKSGEKSRG